MEAKEFVSNTIKTIDKTTLSELKEVMIGEYISFSFVEEKAITTDVFAEKVCDYFEKLELKTGDKFEKLSAKYADDWDEVVKRYLPKEPSAKKGEPIPPMPRSLMYYKRALEIKSSRSMTIKQLADYSRIMMSLYMGSIRNNMKEVANYEFATERLDFEKIINALKAEKSGGILPIGKKTLFDLEELYCPDTATFIISMMMYYLIKYMEIKGEE